MGVYIKGIKMPTRCHECHFNVAGWCYATDRIDNRTSFVTDYPIQPWCPLVPVPEHGRLGDLDELEKLFLNAGANHKGIGGLMTGMPALCVREMPTIIPASKEDKT